MEPTGRLTAHAVDDDQKVLVLVRDAIPFAERLVPAANRTHTVIEP